MSTPGFDHAVHGDPVKEARHPEYRVLILAPFGRDGTLLAGVLQKARLMAETCSDMEALCQALGVCAGAVLIADEALTRSNRKLITDCIAAQPNWSDLPIFVMTQPGGADDRVRSLASELLGNVTLLERPLRSEAVISSLRMGLRSRAHQYAIRAHLQAERCSAEALRESEARYRTLTETLPQMVWTCLPDGNCDYLSRQWLAYTGLPEAEQLGDNWLNAVIHPDDRPRTAQAWAAAVRGESAYDLEYRVRRYDGVYRWFKTRGTPMLDSAGSIRKWIGTCTDVEEQRRALEERQDLLNRERQARATAELLNKVGPTLLGELDTQRLSNKVTEIATELTAAQFGALYRRAPTRHGNEYELQALSAWGSTKPRSHPFAELTSELELLLNTNQVVRVVDLSTSGGENETAPVLRAAALKSLLAAPVLSHTADVTGWMLFGSQTLNAFSQMHEELAIGIAAQAAIALNNARLFAEAQEAQETLRKSNEELRRANEDLNQFAYSASHDLQEPLRMVAIYSQMLQRKYKDKLDQTATDYITYTVQGARRMEMLLKDLLDYTQVVNGVEGVAEQVDAAAVLHRTIEMLAQTIKETNAKVSSGPLPLLQVKEVHLLQLFQNLIGNALKYRSKAEPLISVSAQREGRMWRFNVSDNGIGIDQQYARQIFGLFKRLHGGGSQYEGTGIGLAICQKIVDRYGGRIWVESEGEAQGSTFLFTLPGWEFGPAGSEISASPDSG